ncbi:hypothetical protein CVIRNUC_002892 [Coccomyxa viridis]|uniref:RNA polymerase Rpb4/RPC9 core domain-containing protein n=1 Tax=Coccomyxa viridis TaxID=1274662 RepID=A0AAV1HXH4_9CHLO|nr:hypothetical protein CVIRNUC_002892 [Coccomyxa viridis]
MSTAITEQEENAAEGRFTEVFQRAKALTNVEVANILSKLTQAKKQDDPSYQPNPMLVKTQEYASRFSTTKSEAANNQMRTILEVGGLSSFEAACMVNLLPESAEEAKSLIPSLDMDVGGAGQLADEVVQGMLDEMAPYKQA